MKTFPKVSVLMPNYNAWKYISEAIQSILNQTFTDFEFIIIDDCSTDNSWEIIQEFAKKDSRIIALRNVKNLTVCRTANRALDMVCGEFIARLDSDDVALPERFSQQLDFLEKNPEYILWKNSTITRNKCGNSELIFDKKPNCAECGDDSCEHAWRTPIWWKFWGGGRFGILDAPRDFVQNV